MFTVKNEMDYLVEQDCLVVGLFENEAISGGKISTVDEIMDSYLSDLEKNGDLTGRKNMLARIYTFRKIGAKQLFIVGLGDATAQTAQSLRESFGNACKAVEEAGFAKATLYLDSFVSDNLDLRTTAKLFGEAYTLSTYQFKGFKQSTNDSYKALCHFNVASLLGNEEEITSSIMEGSYYGKGTNFARHLVNLPGNKLTATDLARHAIELGERYPFEVSILEKEQMIEHGMGALLAVNQGSTEPPKMIVIKYQGKDKWEDVIGLVGKGISFDTGGYSLKPGSSMVGMKMDMGGAAAVLGAMEIIGEVKPQQNILAVIPSTDNVISGSAFKPDDVITSMSGKTIEVANTDAEGRLALADGITYAKQLGASYLVDVATLTGGVVIALGNDTTGAMTNNESLLKQVQLASETTGEQIWQLPIFEQDKERVRGSKIADLNNLPCKEGSAIIGGAFVGEFAEDTPWVHLDIAGTATTKNESNLGPSGATGVMSRTLATFIEKFQPFTK